MGEKTTTPTAAPDAALAPARRTTRALLACGVAAGPLFVGVALLQVLTRDGFDWAATRSACWASATWAGSRSPTSWRPVGCRSHSPSGCAGRWGPGRAGT